MNKYDHIRTGSSRTCLHRTFEYCFADKVSLSFRSLERALGVNGSIVDLDLHSGLSSSSKVDLEHVVVRVHRSRVAGARVVVPGRANRARTAAEKSESARTA